MRLSDLRTQELFPWETRCRCGFLVDEVVYKGSAANLVGIVEAKRGDG
jgi:hypothetical protein